MRILLLCNDFVPSIGGVGVHFSSLVKYLTRANQEVVVFAGAEQKGICPQNEYMEYDYYGAKVIHFYIGATISYMGKEIPIDQFDKEAALHAYQFQYTNKIISYLENHRFEIDIIHAHNVFVSTAYKFVKRYFNVPMVVTFHQFYEKKHKLKHALSYYMSNNCDAAIGVSDEVIKYIKMCNSNLPTYKVYNAVDDINYEFNDINMMNKQNIMFCGRLVKNKGVHNLIYAFKILYDKGIAHNIKLNIIGDGELKSSLENLCKELGLQKNIIFHGKKEKNEVQKFYLESKIVVVPSGREGFSTVALEAMSYGACVIASDIASFREMIIHNETGVLVPVGDIHKLSLEIEEVWNNDEKRKKIAINAFYMVKNKFTWTKATKQIIDIYKETISSID